MFDYPAHAKNMQQSAVDAYRQWMSNMSPAEREKLKKLGLDHPPADTHEVTGHSPFETKDVAESPRSRTEIDIASHIDTPAEILAETHQITLAQAEKLILWCREEVATALVKHEAHLLQVVVGGLLSAKNPKLSAAGLAFAAGLDSLNGLGSQSDYARANHVTRSAVSKVVKAWQRALDLRASPHQKSDKACKTYSEVGSERHWRKQKATKSKIMSLLRTSNNAAAAR